MADETELKVVLPGHVGLARIADEIIDYGFDLQGTDRQAREVRFLALGGERRVLTVTPSSTPSGLPCTEVVCPVGPGLPAMMAVLASSMGGSPDLATSVHIRNSGRRTPEREPLPVLKVTMRPDGYTIQAFVHGEGDLPWETVERNCRTDDVEWLKDTAVAEAHRYAVGQGWSNCRTVISDRFMIPAP